jgi:hypothetical protein
MMKESPNRFATRRRANRSEHAFRMHDHLGVSCEWHDSSLTDMQIRRLLCYIWSQFVNGSSRFSRSSVSWPTETRNLGDQQELTEIETGIPFQGNAVPDSGGNG